MPRFLIVVSNSLHCAVDRLDEPVDVELVLTPSVTKNSTSCGVSPGWFVPLPGLGHFAVDVAHRHVVIRGDVVERNPDEQEEFAHPTLFWYISMTPKLADRIASRSHNWSSSTSRDCWRCDRPGQVHFVGGELIDGGVVYNARRLIVVGCLHQRRHAARQLVQAQSDIGSTAPACSCRSG